MPGPGREGRGRCCGGIEMAGGRTGRSVFGFSLKLAIMKLSFIFRDFDTDKQVTEPI